MEHFTPRHLLIGDEHDLPLLKLLLTTLPQGAVGELLLELPGADRPALPAPAGISTRCLTRESELHRGVRAAAALDAWAAEWVHGPHSTARGHSIFVGMPFSPVMGEKCAAMLARHPHLHLHRPAPAISPL